MRKKLILSVAGVLFLTSCSPRNYLTRRLATDLISASDAFKTPQQYVLQTGVVAGKDYSTPEYLILQHHGWISATNAACLVGTFCSLLPVWTRFNPQFRPTRPASLRSPFPSPVENS
jgi:hypothetical protein